MVVTKVLHMNPGHGECSYANNSIIQKIVILKVRPMLENTIKDMYKDGFPKCFNIADLGCSSGPNTILSVSNIIDIVHDLCLQRDGKTPEIVVYLNDLPQNDFNSVFKSLLPFYDKLKKDKGDKFCSSCYVYAMPGSFYERLFPTRSLHFVHSSYSLHWLSQVPEKLENNKENIYIAKGSPPDVLEQYLKQFQRDFSTFLRVRSHEIVTGGCMVLTLLSRSTAHPACKDACGRYELLAKSLTDMVKEGIVQEADLFSFNIPWYLPYEDEVKAIIQEEGSFNIDKIEAFKLKWDASENDGNARCAKTMADGIRALLEPMLASHFGEAIIDDLFARFADHMENYSSIDKPDYFNIVISLSRK